MKEHYFADDRPIDLAKFKGITQNDLEKEIAYLKEQEDARLERAKYQTKEEQAADFEECERRYQQYLEQRQKNREQQLLMV